MPIYEYKCYKCQECGAVTERLQKSILQKYMQGEEKPACSQCGSSKISRIIPTPIVSGEGDCSNRKDSGKVIEKNNKGGR